MVKHKTGKLASTIIVTLILSVFSFVPKTQAFVTPELPRVYLTTTVASTPVTGATINVPAGGDFQAALNSANLGDQIVLQAGSTYTGVYTFPKKTTGSGWITIRTSNMAGITQEGVRIGPSKAAAMPKIMSPTSEPAVRMAFGAHHYRLIGLEIGTNTVNPNYNNLNFGLVDLGAADPISGSYSSDATTIPHDIILDRVYIHGNTNDDDKRGVALNSASTAVIDSYISEIHGNGFDTQAIGAYAGPGPYKVVNNYLEASGENLIFGGADPKVLNIVPSDIEVRGNYLAKPLSWLTKSWQIKNLLELKNSKRILIDGNIMENNWAQAQDGWAVLFTVRNQEGTAPWSDVSDVTFTRNIIRHSGQGIEMHGKDGYNTTVLSSRFLIQNNLFDDINVQWGYGRLIGLFTEAPYIAPTDVTFDHNTFLHTTTGNAAMAMGDSGKSQNITFQNNIYTNGDYGVFGTGVNQGTGALNTYINNWVFQKNVSIIPTPTNPYNTVASYTAGYPPNNSFTIDASSVGFVDYINHNYQLASTSSYKSAGTDGKDIGADIVALNTATAGVITGNGTTSPPPTPVAGDLNLDHIVNSLDWSIMNSKWFTTDANADLNHDGLVNAIDFSILNANWFKTW